MVDNITTSGLRRSKLKNNGEEDPVVVIQRLLNIFRQLHVMNDEQKNAFNELILKQPAEIRHMCAVLPGGSLLQEYVDDLEEQTGQTSDIGFEIEEQTLANNQQNNILAAAMGQNQTTAAPAAAPTVQVADSGINRELQKQMTLIMQELQETKKDLAKVNQQAQAAAIAQAAQSSGGGQASAQPIVMPAVSGPATLTTDENFAKEIASAVTSAFNMAEESRKKETQELAKSITESQKIISRETQELTKSLAESQKQISKETQELTKTLAESQIQMTQRLISELAQRPVVQGEAPVAYSHSPAPADMSGGGTNTVYVQSADTKEITRAITESQLEMAKMFLQHNAISANAQNNTANNIQINNAPAPAVNTEEIISGIIKAQSRLFQEMSQTQTKELSSVIASALKESQQISTKSMIEALRETQNSSTKTMVETLKAFQKENLKFFEKQAKMMPKPTVVQTVMPAGAAAGDAAPVMYSEADTAGNEDTESKTSYIKSVLTKNFSKLMRHSGEETISTEPDILTPDSDNFADTAVPDTETVWDEETPFELTGATETVSEPAEVLPEQSENPQPETDAELSATEDSGVIDFDENNLPEITGEDDNGGLAEEENPEQNFDGPAKKKRKKKKKKKRNANDGNAFSFLGDDDSSAAADVKKENNLSTEDKNFGLDASLFDLDAIETTVPEKDTPNQFSGLDMSLFDHDETEQNTSDEKSADADTFETAVSLTDTDEKQESKQVQSEQIFVDEDIDTIAVVEPEQTEDTFSEELPSAPAYERKRSSFIPDTTTTDDLYSLYNDTQFISENETPVSLNTTEEETIPAVEEDSGEWEWEYEEVDENGDATTTEASAATTDETSDGEWEWEYEEVDENGDSTTTEVSAATADETSDGEWEWEYEEVDENGDSTTTEVSAATADETSEAEWEWEYEEVDENDDTPAAEASASATDETSDGEWEWEYEEVDEPEQAPDTQVGDISFNEEDTSAAFSDDSKTNNTEDNGGDPYTGENGEEPTELEFSTLQSGSLYYQEDINARQEAAPTAINFESADHEEIIIPDSGNEENGFDPYAPK